MRVAYRPYHFVWNTKVYRNDACPRKAYNFPYGTLVIGLYSRPREYAYLKHYFLGEILMYTTLIAHHPYHMHHHLYRPTRIAEMKVVPRAGWTGGIHCSILITNSDGVRLRGKCLKIKDNRIEINLMVGVICRRGFFFVWTFFGLWPIRLTVAYKQETKNPVKCFFSVVIFKNSANGFRKISNVSFTAVCFYCTKLNFQERAECVASWLNRKKLTQGLSVPQLVTKAYVYYIIIIRYGHATIIEFGIPSSPIWQIFRTST